MINIAPTEHTFEPQHFDDFLSFGETMLLDQVTSRSVALHFQLHPHQYPSDLGYEDPAAEAVSSDYCRFVNEFAFRGNRISGRIGRLLVPPECREISEEERLAWLSQAYDRVQGMGETVRTISFEHLLHEFIETGEKHDPNRYYKEYADGVLSKTPRNDVWAFYKDSYTYGRPSIIAVINYERSNPASEAKLAGCDAFVPPYPPGLSEYTDTLRDIYRDVATPLPRLGQVGQ
ncbi:MAG TPA: hypothetical protein VLG16_01630 [Candidatus Saccharimonadales bacterium]|nr:hypothetical protein [Candidatus Saccharimonadales bacterium]